MPPEERATGKDIILDIVENMRAYQEELLYSSMVPTQFVVHLHRADHDRLEGIFPSIVAEARRALDEALSRQNRQSGPEWLRKLRGAPPPAQPAQDAWTITFHRDENDELGPGDVLVESRLALPQPLELGGGNRTRRITTTRLGNVTSTRSQVLDEPAVLSSAEPPAFGTPARAPAEATPAASSAASRTAVADAGDPEAAASPPTTRQRTVFATLTYEDRSGRHTYEITQNHVVIGRGGPGYWVDLRVDAATDVSREHVRLRRDERAGQFFLKDLSTFGTTIDGARMATSIDTTNGVREDLNVEVPLPPVARIGLAGMVFLDFRLQVSS